MLSGPCGMIGKTIAKGIALNECSAIGINANQARCFNVKVASVIPAVTIKRIGTIGHHLDIAQQFPGLEVLQEGSHHLGSDVREAHRPERWHDPALEVPSVLRPSVGGDVRGLQVLLGVDPQGHGCTGDRIHPG